MQNNNIKKLSLTKLLGVNKAFVQQEDQLTQEREDIKTKQKRQKEEGRGDSCTDIYTAARLLKVVECCRLQIPDQRRYCNIF